MYSKDWFNKWAIYSPNKVAIEEYETGRSLTYADLDTNANKLATILGREKITKGDRVLVIAEHSLELVTLFGAAQKTGVIIVPINYRLTPYEIDFLVKDCDPSLILYDEHFLDKISEVEQGEYSSKTIQELSQLIKTEPIQAYTTQQIKNDDPIFILYTSGTTGSPKGAIYTHKMLFWNSLNTSLSISLTADDHTINCMPAFHTGGWNVLLTPMLHLGATVGLIKKFDPDYVLELLDQKQSTVFMGVPTMLKMMKDSNTFDLVQLEKLRYFIVGGEALPHAVIKSWHHKGISLRQGYGMTEAGPNLTSLHQDNAEAKLGSIGRPNFYIESKLMDEDFNEVNKGEIGEFCLRGEVVTPGYWKNEQATQDAFNKGWLKTGDLMRQDDDGYLSVVDRKKSMFISGGENVYPAEVERVIALAPGVKEVAVIGVPDEKWGEVGKAFLVLTNGNTSEGVDAFCLDKLAKFKIPKHYHVIHELPKNDSGKIDRKTLKSL